MSSAALVALLGLAPASCARSEPPAIAGFRGVGGPVEFGRVFEGSILEHTFELEVDAGASPTIEAAHADCGCTVARLELEGPGDLARRPYEEGARLAPGTRVLVHVRYDTRGKAGDAPRTVSLYTNPGGKVEVALRAEVVPWLLASPDRFDLPPCDEQRTFEVAFRVHSSDGTAFHLAPTREALPPDVRVDVAPVGGGERAAEWQAHATFGPGLPRGQHAWPIELATDVPVPGPEGAAGARSFSVAPLVTVQIVGAILPSVPSLSFGALRGDEVASCSLRLSCMEEGFLFAEPRARFVPAREQDAPLARTAEVHVRPVDGENAWTVELVLAGLDPEVRGTFLGHLVIETDHPRDPALEIPVTGFRRDAAPRAGDAPDPGTPSRLVGPPRGD